MPEALPIRVSLKPIETANSFASRLAKANGAPSARDFCTDMALSWRDINRGDPDAIAVLADFGGVPRKPLQQYSLRQVRLGSYQLGSVDLSVRGVNRTKLKVCPLCILEDEQLGGPCGPAQRATWQIDYIRTCPQHLCMLAPLPKRGYPVERYDFVNQISMASEDLANIEVERIEKKSALENYLVNRLEGGRQFEWLDGQSFNAAAKVCERVGAGLLGRGRHVRKLTSADWVISAEAGFHALKDGAKSLEPALLKYLDQRGAARLSHGAELPDFHAWLHSANQVSEQKPILELFRHFISKHFRLPEGTKIYGQRACGTGLVSVSQARSMIRSKGICSSDILSSIPLVTASSRAKLLTVDDVRIASENILKLTTAKSVANHLGCDLLFLRELIGRRFLRRRNSSGRRGSKCTQEEIDRFISQLEGLMTPTTESNSNYVPLKVACKRVRMKRIDAIGMVLSGKLGVAKHDDRPTILDALLVDFEELKSLAHSQLNPSAIVICRQLHINRATLWKLTDEGFLPKSDWRSTSPFFQTRNVQSNDVKRFQKKYVSMGELCTRYQRPPTWINARIEKPSPEPLFQEARFSRIFHRSALSLTI